MKRDELDAMIQHAMEKQTEHLHANPMMLERIKREAGVKRAEGENFHEIIYSKKNCGCCSCMFCICYLLCGSAFQRRRGTDYC